MFSVFYQQYELDTIFLVVYIDDIVIRGCDYEGISSIKFFLHAQLHSDDFAGQLKYFWE